MKKIMLEAKTDKRFASALDTAEVNCWGIFKTSHHKTPIVYCQSEEVAIQMKSDKTYHHYNSRYNNCVIKKIEKMHDLT